MTRLLFMTFHRYKSDIYLRSMNLAYVNLVKQHIP